MGKIYTKLALSALMGVMSLVANAQSFSVKELSYAIQDGEAVITGCEKVTGDTVAIPEVVSYDGKSYKVTAIGDDAFRGCTTVKTVLFNSSIRSIGRSAFKGCTSLKNSGKPNIPKVFYTPASLEELGDSAFAESGLLFLYMVDSKNIDYIPNGIIDRCPNIEELKTPRFYDDNKVGDIGVIKTSAKTFYICKTKRGLDLPAAFANLKVESQTKKKIVWYIGDDYATWKYEQADGTLEYANRSDAEARTKSYYKIFYDNNIDLNNQWWPAFGPLGDDWDEHEIFHIIPYNSTTGITDVLSSHDDIRESRYYDLQGRVVESPKAGQLYIHNGKKVIF